MAVLLTGPDWQRDNNEEHRSAAELEALLWPGWPPGEENARQGPDHSRPPRAYLPEPDEE